MKLNNVKTVTKKQAKAYAVIALDILESTPNDIDVAMKLYSPREATEKAEKIKAKGGLVKWMKK